MFSMSFVYKKDSRSCFEAPLISSKSTPLCLGLVAQLGAQLPSQRAMLFHEQNNSRF